MTSPLPCAARPGLPVQERLQSYTVLATSFWIASADASTPECVYGMPRTSSMPCNVPSSPGRPCRTLSAASGLSALNVAPMSRLTSTRLTRYPVRSSVGAGFAPNAKTLRAQPTSPHQDRNVLHCLSVTPTRLISHSRSIPEFSLTFSRTVSPKVSISAALALPRLIRKLL